MNIVVVTAAGQVPQEPLGVVSDDVLIRFLMPATGGGHRTRDTHVVHMPTGNGARLGDRIAAVMQSNAALRMLLRISPLDRGARYWRAMRGDAQAKRFIQGADLLVAADRDANYACWHLARHTSIPAVSGYAAAKKELQRRTVA